MHARRGPKIVVLRGQCMHLGKFFYGGANAQSARHLSFGHFLSNGRQIRQKRRIVQMAMRVREHGQSIQAN
jgi:hypothetical protein